MLLKTTSRLEQQCCNDFALVEAAQNGDREAFEVLAERHRRTVFAIGWRITRNRQDAEDIAQEAFLKAFVHLRTFRAEASFSTWLVRIALNEAVMLRRRVWRTREVSSSEPADGEFQSRTHEPEDPYRNPEERLAEKEQRQILHSFIGSLPPHSRSVIQSHDLEERSVKETAAHLEISISAVKSRISRARSTLRNKVERHFGQSRSLSGIASYRSPRSTDGCAK
jgi:RNA polymerase sigma-70 factor, ECF subfamily